MHLRQPNWTRILTILLVILASLALLYISISILARFTHALLLFVVGTIVAYILTPLVNRLEAAFHFRWVAIVLAYCMVAVGIFALALMLFTPFIDQTKSLVDNLQNPSTSSLITIDKVRASTSRIQQDMRNQQAYLTNFTSLPASTQVDRHTGVVVKPVQKVEAEIAALKRDVHDLKNGTVFGLSHTPRVSGAGAPGRIPPNPQPQTQVPESYARVVTRAVTRLSTDYRDANRLPASIDMTIFSQSVSDARKAYSRATEVQHTMATTPILVLRAQVWVDQHGISADLASKFGQAARQLSDQGTNLLDNAITILSGAANALLDITLILIIAFYLLHDGRRLIRQAREVLPADYREQGVFFLTSLDRVLGGYIRGQLFLSLLAGLLGGGGAAVLGIPYPLLIGIVTFFLETVPVIGPMVAVVPAVAVSLFFMPILTTVELFVWFVVFQQVVTNILGPRIMGAAVGVHPLEALLAVLVGFPLGGFLGAFLAVPVAGIVHIMVREAYVYWVLGGSVKPPPVNVEALPEVRSAPGSLPRAKPDSAAGRIGS